MTQTVPVESEYLRSGDMIDLEYQIVGRNETMIALAVHSIKQSIAADKRIDYQSGRREYRTDLGTGINYEFLIVRVIVRDYPRGDPPPDPQLAGVGIVFISIAAIVVAISAAVIAYSPALVYRGYSPIRPGGGEEATPAGGTVAPWILVGGVILGLYFAAKLIRRD